MASGHEGVGGTSEGKSEVVAMHDPPMDTPHVGFREDFH